MFGNCRDCGRVVYGEDHVCKRGRAREDGASKTGGVGGQHWTCIACGESQPYTKSGTTNCRRCQKETYVVGLGEPDDGARAEGPRQESVQSTDSSPTLPSAAPSRDTPCLTAQDVVDALDKGWLENVSAEKVAGFLNARLRGNPTKGADQALVISPQDIAAARQAWIDERCDAKGINANEWFAAFLSSRMRKDG